MAFSLLPILIHSEDVPPEARSALRLAESAPETQRAAALEHAAHVLYTQTDLDCGEVRDMLDIPAGPCS